MGQETIQSPCLYRNGTLVRDTDIKPTDKGIYFEAVVSAMRKTKVRGGLDSVHGMLFWIEWSERSSLGKCHWSRCLNEERQWAIRISGKITTDWENRSCNHPETGMQLAYLRNSRRLVARTQWASRIGWKARSKRCPRPHCVWPWKQTKGLWV